MITLQCRTDKPLAQDTWATQWYKRVAVITRGRWFESAAALYSYSPANLTELLHVSGVGESKLRKYGNDVLGVLRAEPA